MLFCLRFSGHSCELPLPNRGTCLNSIIIGFGKHTHHTAHTHTHSPTENKEACLQRVKSTKERTHTYPYPHKHMLVSQQCVSVGRHNFQTHRINPMLYKLRLWISKLQVEVEMLASLPNSPKIRLLKCSKKPLLWGNRITPGVRTRDHCAELCIRACAVVVVRVERQCEDARVCQRLRCNVLFQGPNPIFSRLFCF